MLTAAKKGRRASDGDAGAAGRAGTPNVRRRRRPPPSAGFLHVDKIDLLTASPHSMRTRR